MVTPERPELGQLWSTFLGAPIELDTPISQLVVERATFAQFIDNCKAAGIRLHPGITSADATVSRHASLIAPTPSLEAFCTISEVLGSTLRSPIHIAEGPGTIQLPDNSGVTLRALARLVQSMLNPYELPMPSTPYAPLSTNGAHFCQDAEGKFTVTLRDLFSSARPAAMRFGCQIILDGDVPVAIRKSLGEPTALTLSEITIGSSRGNLPYPAGSLVQIEMVDDQPDPVPSLASFALPDSGVEMVPWTAVTAVRPGRLSVFALPPGNERSVCAELIETTGSTTWTPYAQWDAIKTFLATQSIAAIQQRVKEWVVTRHNDPV